MVGFRIDWPQTQFIDANGQPDPDAKWYVYLTETTTPVDLFTDRDVGVTATNPVETDDAGRFPVRYVDTSALLTLVLKDGAGDEILSIDDFEPVPGIDNAALANYLALAGGTMTGAIRFKEGAAVASATSINLDASGGNFNHISGTTTISTVTLAEGAMRWVVFDAALTLTNSANLILLGAANITTAAGDMALFVGEGVGVTRMLRYTLVSGKSLIESAEILLAVGDESTAITTGAAKITFRMPFAMTLDALPRASLTASSSSGLPAIDVNMNGASIFATTVTINVGATTSETATTPAVLSTTALTDNAVMTINVDTAGTNAAGLKVLLRGYRRNRS